MNWISSATFGFILGMFAVAMAISSGPTIATFVLLAILLILVVVILQPREGNKRENSAIYPLIGMLFGGLIGALPATTPVGMDGFNVLLAFLISLYSVEHI